MRLWLSSAARLKLAIELLDCLRRLPAAAHGPIQSYELRGQIGLVALQRFSGVVKTALGIENRLIVGEPRLYTGDDARPHRGHPLEKLPAPSARAATPSV